MSINKYQIYIGLNDSVTRQQMHSTEIFQKIVCSVCKGYHVGFSVSELHGGYFHDDGTFVSENSLCLTLIGAADDMVDEIAKDICAFFHQESVLVTKVNEDCRFVQNSLE